MSINNGKLKKKKTAPHVILNIICYYINAIAYISVHLSNNQTVSNANNDTENEPSVYLCIYLYPHRAIEYIPYETPTWQQDRTHGYESQPIKTKALNYNWQTKQHRSVANVLLPATQNHLIPP